MLISLLTDHFGGAEPAFDFMFHFAGLDLRMPKDLELQRLRSEWMKRGKKPFDVHVRGDNLKRVVTRIMATAAVEQSRTNGTPRKAASQVVRRRRPACIRPRTLRDCAGQLSLF